MRFLPPFLSLLLLWSAVARAAPATNNPTSTLEERLTSEDPGALAKAARELGDPRRGAVTFYQPHLACTKCHVAGKDQPSLGPDLAKKDGDVNDAAVVESVLEPSKVIKQGFEPLTVITKDGAAVVGLRVAEDADKLVMRSGSGDFKKLTLQTKNIVTRATSTVSIMPTGLVNQLANRQQFLDLVRYLMDIRDGGVGRARELEPPPALYQARPLPEYEKRIDHAGMIADLNDESFERGEAIYSRLCVNCHGTHEKPGTLPTSLPFAKGQFKNGNDPYSMYKTLTHGFGMMVPQTWMVPEQKYDTIHYIRAAYLKPHNRSQYFPVDKAYLDGLPKGTTRGPKPSEILPWERMDYGPNLVQTYEIGDDATNFTYKGNAVRLDPGPGGVSRGRYWMVFDYDTLRVAAAWAGKGFVDWNGINFNGEHQRHLRIAGEVHLANFTGPGWAHPETGSFDDPRIRGRDDRPYGPLPRDWAHLKGMYAHGHKTVVSYTVGETFVLEKPGHEVVNDAPVFTRTFNVGPRRRDMVLQVAHRPQSSTAWTISRTGLGLDAPVLVGSSKADYLAAGVVGTLEKPNWSLVKDKGGALRLRIPAGREPLQFVLWTARVEKTADAVALTSALEFDEELDLKPLTRGGPSRWPEVLKTQPVIADDNGPLAVDVLTYPAENPWFCRMRLSGLDFYPDGDRAVVCDWDGIMWLVSGLSKLPRTGEASATRTITWKRIASGMFQPLGVKILNGQIYVTCRDQISILHDLNGDGETDYYENFNNDHQVTEHFHEFAMGLQADAEGNLYYAKSARHAKTALVPHHGTLLGVTKDGSRTDILATGFRAANGVCLNPDGTFIVTDQEGHWNPKNRINWVKKGGFYGNMYGYHDVTNESDEAMEQPLCWITNSFDRSPAELLWVDSPAWGPLNGALLNSSYGYGKLYIVPHEEINGQKQGGMCEFPIAQFPTGIMRGRFHPVDGQLYVCGLVAWSSAQPEPGGLFRLRYTGKPVHLPVGLNAKRDGMAITFSGELHREAATDRANYSIKVWSLKRTKEYGSEHYNEHALDIAKAELSADGKRVFLKMPQIAPTWSMEIKYSIKGKNGENVNGLIHNTIHYLGN